MTDELREILEKLIAAIVANDRQAQIALAREAKELLDKPQ